MNIFYALWGYRKRRLGCFPNNRRLRINIAQILLKIRCKVPCVNSAKMKHRAVVAVASSRSSECRGSPKRKWMLKPSRRWAIAQQHAKNARTSSPGKWELWYRRWGGKRSFTFDPTLLGRLPVFCCEVLEVKLWDEFARLTVEDFLGFCQLF